LPGVVLRAVVPTNAPGSPVTDDLIASLRGSPQHGLRLIASAEDRGEPPHARSRSR
jgi:hypothetical protein